MMLCCTRQKLTTKDKCITPERATRSVQYCSRAQVFPLAHWKWLDWFGSAKFMPNKAILSGDAPAKPKSTTMTTMIEDILSFLNRGYLCTFAVQCKLFKQRFCPDWDCFICSFYKICAYNRYSEGRSIVYTWNWWDKVDVIVCWCAAYNFLYIFLLSPSLSRLKHILPYSSSDIIGSRKANENLSCAKQIGLATSFPYFRGAYFRLFTLITPLRSCRVLSVCVCVRSHYTMLFAYLALTISYGDC